MSDPYSELEEDDRVLRFLSWCIVGRAYKDCQATDLMLGGYIDNRSPKEVRERLGEELQQEAEAWFLGEGDGAGLECEELLDVLRRLGIEVPTGAEYLEQAKAGVKWPAKKPW